MTSLLNKLEYSISDKVLVDASSTDWKNHTYRVDYVREDGVKGSVTMSLRDADGYGLHHTILRDIENNQAK